MKTLLVATRPEARDSIFKNLDGHYRILFYSTMSETMSAMNQHQIDLIACGIHFGEGELYDLLRYAKALPRTKSIPFIAVYGSGTELSPAMRQSVEIATRALGADAFVELAQWKAELGDEKAHKKLREVLDKLV
jgi:CheY-like chemotaxis protein